jgi:hypothetical protein
VLALWGPRRLGGLGAVAVVTVAAVPVVLIVVLAVAVMLVLGVLAWVFAVPITCMLDGMCHVCVHAG